MEILCQQEIIHEPSKTLESKTENISVPSTTGTKNQNSQENEKPTKENIILPVGRIYLITNLINNKKYVGITTRTLKNRWSEHCYPTKSRPGRLLSKAIKKYGKENFKVELIEELHNISGEILLSKETFYIEKYNTFVDNGFGYNLIKESTQKFIYSELTREKMSKSKKGNKNNFYGKLHTTKSKRLMSKSHKGNKSHLGKPHSKETKGKLSKLLSGKCHPRFNPTLMTFQNIITGELFTGVQFDFRNKYALKNSTLSKLINGKTKSYKGWMLLKK